MEVQNAPGGQPPATTAVTPAAAPAEASSSTVQKDFNSRVTEAKTPADIRRLTQEMVAISPKPGSQPKPAIPAPVAEAPAAEATPAEVATETSPEGEVTPPAEDTTEQPAEAAAEPDQAPEGEEEGGEGPVTPLTGKRAHIRIPDSEVDKLALAYQRRNRDWSLEQSLEAAKKQLGIKSQPAPEATPETPAVNALPQSTQDTDTLIEQRFADYEKAMSEVRFEDAAKINREILKLTVHRTTLERRAEQQQVAAAAKYDADFDASNSKAVDLYPFAADPASPGFKRMMQLDAQFKRDEDPLYHSPNKPFKLAQMVAAELNIAPRNKSAAPAQKAAAVVTPPPPKKGVVPSGSSRTTPPATNQPAVDPAISGIKTMTDLRTQLRRFGVK